MAIEAPLSKSAKNWLLIYVVGLAALAGWFAYDGFFNRSFIEAHTDAEGQTEFALWFNQKSPPFFLGAALLVGLRLLIVRKRRIVAEEQALVINDRVRIAYDAIQEIDKTHFKEKGVFVLAYDEPGGKRVRRKIDGRDYENVSAVLDHLVAQIS